MNCWEAASKMFTISERIKELAIKKGRVSKPNESKKLDNQIDDLDRKFLLLKHSLEAIKYTELR